MLLHFNLINQNNQHAILINFIFMRQNSHVIPKNTHSHKTLYYSDLMILYFAQNIQTVEEKKLSKERETGDDNHSFRQIEWIHSRHRLIG